jgi:hypothetical protein
MHLEERIKRTIINMFVFVSSIRVQPRFPAYNLDELQFCETRPIEQSDHCCSCIIIIIIIIKFSCFQYHYVLFLFMARPSGRADYGVDLRPLVAEIVGANPTAAWTSVSCECCVLSGRGL